MTFSDLVPAVGGFLFAVGLWSYAHYMKHRLDTERAADKNNRR